MDDDVLMRFCKLTLLSCEDDEDRRIRLWLNRIVEEGAYYYKEDYMTGFFSWEMCLTPYEQECLERYLWDNNITNFTFDVYGDRMKSTMFSTDRKGE